MTNNVEITELDEYDDGKYLVSFLDSDNNNWAVSSSRECAKIWIYEPDLECCSYLMSRGFILDEINTYEKVIDAINKYGRSGLYGEALKPNWNKPKK